MAGDLKLRTTVGGEPTDMSPGQALGPALASVPVVLSGGPTTIPDGLNQALGTASQALALAQQASDALGGGKPEDYDFALETDVDSVDDWSF